MRKIPTKSSVQDEITQLTFRVPGWISKQLKEDAKKKGVSLNTHITQMFLLAPIPKRTFH